MKHLIFELFFYYSPNNNIYNILNLTLILSGVKSHSNQVTELSVVFIVTQILFFTSVSQSFVPAIILSDEVNNLQRIQFKYL